MESIPSRFCVEDIGDRESISFAQGKWAFTFLLTFLVITLLKIEEIGGTASSKLVAVNDDFPSLSEGILYLKE